MVYWAQECRSKAKKAEANVAQDDEPALLLAEVVIVEAETVAPPPPTIFLPPHPTSQALLWLPSQEESTPTRTTSGPHWVAVHLVEAKMGAGYMHDQSHDGKQIRVL
jgi:hypothetical protein